jgi:hypothetical protein
VQTASGRRRKPGNGQNAAAQLSGGRAEDNHLASPSLDLLRLGSVISILSQSTGEGANATSKRPSLGDENTALLDAEWAEALP